MIIWMVFDFNALCPGVITKTTLFSDCLFPHMIELLQQRLVNVKYDAAALNQVGLTCVQCFLLRRP